jgi:uncharacterized protein with HEPN domain
MQRDILLLGEMIDAVEQAQQLATDISVSQLEADRQRRDALLWNFTVLGEAAGQLSAEVKAKFPDVAWQQPIRLRNRIVHGYWSIDLDVLHNCSRAVAELRCQPASRSKQPDAALTISSRTVPLPRGWVSGRPAPSCPAGAGRRRFRTPSCRPAAGRSG